MRSLSLIAMLALSLSSQAAIYKWVDNNGTVHFGDTPKPNAELVELKDTSGNAAPIQVIARGNLNRDGSQTEVSAYQISISEPQQEATIRENDGNFSVTARAKPEPPAGALWVLLLDGEVWGDAMKEPIFNLTNIDRGQHSLEVQLITQNGKVIASSQPITVFLHRGNMLTRPNKVMPRAGN